MKTYRVATTSSTRQGDFTIIEPQVVTVRCQIASIENGALVFYDNGPVKAFAPGVWAFFEEVTPDD